MDSIYSTYCLLSNINQVVKFLTIPTIIVPLQLSSYAYKSYKYFYPNEAQTTVLIVDNTINTNEENDVKDESREIFEKINNNKIEE